MKSPVAENCKRIEGHFIMREKEKGRVKWKRKKKGLYMRQVHM